MAQTQTPATEAPDAKLHPAAPIAVACALLSVGGCLVSGVVGAVANVPEAIWVVFVMPIFGLVGAVLGVVARLQIARSGDRLGGRIPANIAIFLGVASALIQGSMVLGASVYYLSLRDNVAPAAEQMLQSVQQGDMDSARATLNALADEQVTDERFGAFLDEIEREIGPLQKSDVSLSIMADLRKALNEAARRGATADTTVTPRPVYLVGDSGRLLAMVILDEQALDQRQVMIVDMLVLLDGDAAIALRPDGPARGLARDLALEAVDLRE